MLAVINLRGREVRIMAFADKKRMVEYNESYKREHYDRIDVRFRKGGKELIKIAADAAGESVASYIKGAVASRLEDDGLTVPADF